jgi:hypothetical protein
MNADLLSHLYINFPVAESVDGQPGQIMLREDNLYNEERQERLGQGRVDQERLDQ